MANALLQVAVQWVNPAGETVDYVADSCINPRAIVLRVERFTAKPLAFDVEGYTFDTPSGEPAWKVMRAPSRV